MLAPPRGQRVSFVSLGCAKNLVDSEVMIGKLGAAGWELVPDAADADAIVVNTCAFIDPAKAESTDVILEHAQRKRPDQQLIVAGCLSQRFGAELQALIPEIDGVVGTGAYAGIVELLEDAKAGMKPVRLDFEPEPEHDFLPRLITTPSATAYLKIAEGCDHPCTFCIIPQLRGSFRSRSEESILMEARALAAGGTKELILIAQDTSMYGRDRGARRPRDAAREAQRNRGTRLDPAAVSLPRDRRQRIDRCDGDAAEGLHLHGHAAAALASGDAAVDEASVQRRAQSRNHR
jgi:ribosomal protein S12 methylthiotransferase